ncbi:MAG: tRNA threonylcarbamoyladenosine dehydratase [Clostridia bacterium]|nr:tRNA threonylcarbamoyladenosine dehydratase [Clostridia bacterium]
MQAFNRVKTLIGKDKLDILQSSHVAVFGIGGVGGYTAEALVRSGIGEITIIDNDTVELSNLNRQIIATVNSLGKDKVSVMKERLLSINPSLKIHAEKMFYLPENASQIDLKKFDYIVDAIDTVTAKLEVVLRAKSLNVPVISCMGTGGKTDVTALKVSDIKNTKVCPLARVVRRELNKRGVDSLKVVYSEEQTVISKDDLDGAEQKQSGRIAPPSMVFVPATAGLMLAREVVFDLIKE